MNKHDVVSWYVSIMVKCYYKQIKYKGSFLGFFLNIQELMDRVKMPGKEAGVNSVNGEIIFPGTHIQGTGYRLLVVV